MHVILNDYLHAVSLFSARLSLSPTAWTDPCLSAAPAWARVCSANSPRTFTNCRPIPAPTWEQGRLAGREVYPSNLTTMATHTTETVFFFLNLDHLVCLTLMFACSSNSIHSQDCWCMWILFFWLTSRTHPCFNFHWPTLDYWQRHNNLDQLQMLCYRDSSLYYNKI